VEFNKGNLTIRNRSAGSFDHAEDHHQAGTLLEALPYIQRFRSQIFVVKYGGSFMDSPDPAERHRVAREIVFLESVGINPVVVHAAGKRYPGSGEAAGLKTKFCRDNALTDEATVKSWTTFSPPRSTRKLSRPSRARGQSARSPGSEIFRCRKLR